MPRKKDDTPQRLTPLDIKRATDTLIALGELVERRAVAELYSRKIAYIRGALTTAIRERIIGIALKGIPRIKQAQAAKLLTAAVADIFQEAAALTFSEPELHGITIDIDPPPEPAPVARASRAPERARRKRTPARKLSGAQKKPKRKPARR